MFLAVVSSECVTGLAVWYIPYWRSFISCHVTSDWAQEGLQAHVEWLRPFKELHFPFFNSEESATQNTELSHQYTCIAKAYEIRNNLHLQNK